MDVKAILLVGGHAADAEQIAGTPIALLDVLGEPVLQRVMERLSRLGVTATTVVSEIEDSPALGVRNRLRPDIHWITSGAGELWRAAEKQFNEYAQHGAELVLLVRVGPYLDIDYEEFIQFHLDRGARTSVVTDADGVSFDTFLVNASRRNDAAHLLRSALKSSRTQRQEFRFKGYANRLRNAADLRALALAAFAGECSIRPAGREIRPGVWAADTARLHRRARLLAPAYIGRHARVRASAVITRGSVIEHHAVVDCGSVIENSTILPHSYVGAGLDLAQSVVGFRQVFSMPRNASVEISDERLIGQTSTSAPVRTLNSAIDLVGFLPRALFSGFGRKSQATTCETEPLTAAVNTPSPALSAVPSEAARPEVSDFPPDFLTARRYGNE